MQIRPNGLNMFKFSIILLLKIWSILYNYNIIILILFQAAAAGAGGDAEEDEDIDDEGKNLLNLF